MSNVSGQTVKQVSSLQDAFDQLLSSGIASDIDMNNNRIIGLPTTSVYDTEAMSRQETYLLFVQGGGGITTLTDIGTLNSALPLTRNLDLSDTGNVNGYKLLIENGTSSKHAANYGQVASEAQTRQTNDETLQTNIDQNKTDQLIVNGQLQDNIDTIEQIVIQNKADQLLVNADLQEQITETGGLINSNYIINNTANQKVLADVSDIKLLTNGSTIAISNQQLEGVNYQQIVGEDLLLIGAGDPNSNPAFQIFSTDTMTQLSQNLGIQFNSKIGNVTGIDITENRQFATKEYVDDGLDLKYDKTYTLNEISKDGMTALDMTQKSIINLYLPDVPGNYDAVNRNLLTTYVASQIESLKIQTAGINTTTSTADKIVIVDNDTLQESDIASYSYTNSGFQGFLQTTNDLTATKADQTDLDQEISDRAQQDTILQGQIDNKANTSDLVNYYTKTQIDSQITQVGTDIDTEETARISADSLLQTAINLKADQSTTYTKTATDTLLSAKLNSSSYHSDYIQFTGGNSQILCNGGNEILVKSNGNQIGKLYQPTGQIDNNFGILATNKLQLSNGLNSTSVYGQKAIDQNLSVLNSNGLYVNSTDSATANVQNFVNCESGGAEIYMTAGHLSSTLGGQKYGVLASNCNLSLSGGLSTGIDDPTLVIYSEENKTLGSNVFVFSDKAGYKTIESPNQITITHDDQFTNKKYVDDALLLKYDSTTVLNSITAPSGDLSLNSHKITNLLDPTSNQDAATKKYVDDHAGSGGIANPLTADINANSLYKIKNLIEPTLAQDSATKNYVDSKVPTIQQNEFCLLEARSVIPAINNSFTNSMWGVQLFSTTHPNISYDTGTGNVTLKANSTYKISLSHHMNGTATSAAIRFVFFNMTTNTAYYSASNLMYSILNINGLNTITGESGSEFCEFMIQPISDLICNVVPTLNQNVNTTTNNTFFRFLIEPIGNQLVLSANSIYSDHLLLNSDIDASTGGYKLKTTTGISGSDCVNYDQLVLKMDASKTLNQIATSNVCTADVSLNNKKITNLAVGSVLTDAIQLAQLKTLQFDIDCNTNYTLVNCKDPVNAQDVATKNWVVNNVNVGTSSTIMNSTQNNCKLVCNLAEITNGNYPLNMNLQKITSLLTPTLTTDAVNKQYCDATTKAIITDGTNTVYFSSGLCRIKNGGIQYVHSIDPSGSINEFYSGDHLFYTYGGIQLFRITSSQIYANKKLAIQTSNTVARNDVLYLDGGLGTPSNYILNVIPGASNKSKIAGSLELTGQVKISSGLDNYIASGTSANDKLFIGQTSGWYDTATNLQIYRSGAGGSSGQYVCALYGSIICYGSYDTYVPISQRQYKKQIQSPDLSCLEGVQMRQFYYDKQALIDLGKNEIAEMVNEDQLQLGFIVDEVDSKYHTTGKQDTISVNITKLKDDFFCFLIQQNIQKTQQISQLQQQLADIKAFIGMQ